jgi:ferric-dicitrate binding protein FerR (iron transport regulator)
MEKDNFFELIDKYFSVETSLEDNKLLHNYYESFQSASEWDEAIGSKDRIETKMLERIQEAMNAEEVAVIPIKRFYQKTIFKLAVAASIVFLISTPILFNLKVPAKANKSIVVNNKIKIGTDKATLTLGDGSVVTLEKGKKYTSGNVKSNGEKLIYNATNTAQSAIASNYLTIPRGGQFFVQLADSTKVWLNSESQLKFPVAFVDGETRQVELVYGEAYFEVSPSTKHKGAKFKVNTKIQLVEVIGTEFNIKAYKGESTIYTTLVKGKVAISNAITKLFLAPDEQSNFNLKSNSINISKVDVYSETSWRKGIFVFKGMPLKEIAKVLSRWYDVEIEFADKALENVKFNGVLNKNQNLEEILTTIKNTNFITAYEIKNKKITLK